ncbi:Uncharacterized protein PCOAH_00003880 [Plasmodium coatneyi]|uniref:Uncharacterized protein n=1 Tax=Plasmodium coatneyi TaxID=208452 RepID=A0A1B1DT68_9APIC|nr:Uncharacterized protein PCOAH_00003880 [Plasmodium coatneyi]ANQ05981.1 Uncharacterized protein PCOAH_00003880 [Plasmodium coatneyi]
MRWGVSPYNIMHSQDVPPKHYRHDEGAKKECTTVGSKKRSPPEGCRKSARDIYLVVAKFFVCVSLAWMLCTPSNCPVCITPNEEHHSGSQPQFPSEGRSLSSFGVAYDGSRDSLRSKISDSLCDGSADSLLSGSTCSLLSGSFSSLFNGSTSSLLNGSTSSLLNGSSSSLLNGSTDSLQHDATRDNPHLTLYYRIANSKKLKQLVDYISSRLMKNRICRKIMDKVKKVWKSKPMKVVRFVVPFLPLVTMMVASVTTLCMGLSTQAIFIAIFAPFAYPFIFISLRTDGKYVEKEKGKKSTYK